MIGNINFMFCSLLLIDTRIFALNNIHKNIPNEVGKLKIRHKDMNIHKKGVDDRSSLRNGIHHERNEINDIILRVQPVQLFYEPSVPRPKQYFRGNKELRQAIYGKLFTRRVNRATQAGYTNNVDTCMLYNQNLAKVWSTLSKFISPDQKMPGKMALHNIILLVKGYLDHNSVLTNDEDTKNYNDNKDLKEEHSCEIIHEIKDLLDNPVIAKDEMPGEIVAVIISHIKKPSEREYEVCLEDSIDKLKYNVNREYQRYVEFSRCRRVYELGKRVLEKMKPNDAKTFLRQWEEDPENKCSTIAKNTFLEAMKAIIDNYDNDVQCLGKLSEK